MAKHRSHSIEFKRQVAQEFIADETLHALSSRHDVSRNLIRIWVPKVETLRRNEHPVGVLERSRLDPVEPNHKGLAPSQKASRACGVGQMKSAIASPPTEPRNIGSEEAIKLLRPVFDPKKPTALFVGRYQQFHDGHRALIVEGLKRVGQACIAVRNTQGVDDKNPFDFEYVRSRIEHGLREFEGRFIVIPLPNVTNIFYGRDVGYAIERIDLDAATEEVSATEVRKKTLASH